MKNFIFFAIITILLSIELASSEFTYMERTYPDTEIVITSPVFHEVYHVGDRIPIEYISLLLNRTDLWWSTYVSGPDGIQISKTWIPKVPGSYWIHVYAKVFGNETSFGTSEEIIVE